MSAVFFPSLPGLGWDIQINPMFNTIIQKSMQPGKETRLTTATQPGGTIVCKYNFLRDATPDDESGFTELTTIVGFFKQRGGSFDSFLLNLTQLTQNPADSEVAGNQVGVGNAVNRAFQVSRNYGGFQEECYAPQSLVVYLGGVDQTGLGSYTVANGLITFAVAPGSGVLVTVDYVHVYIVRFDKDAIQVRNFMYQLYDLQIVTFQVLLTP